MQMLGLDLAGLNIIIAMLGTAAGYGSNQAWRDVREKVGEVENNVS